MIMSASNKHISVGIICNIELKVQAIYSSNCCFLYFVFQHQENFQIRRGHLKGHIFQMVYNFCPGQKILGDAAYTLTNQVVLCPNVGSQRESKNNDAGMIGLCNITRHHQFAVAYLPLDWETQYSAQVGYMVIFHRDMHFFQEICLKTFNHLTLYNFHIQYWDYRHLQMKPGNHDKHIVDIIHYHP